MRTGDLGRWRADGTIEVLGRRDGQVKLRGYRIELGEIAAVLAQHSGVREAIVSLREDLPGQQRLVAYVVPNDERRTTNDESESPTLANRHSSFVDELKGFLAERLPQYMVPSAFVALDALPRTPNGKLDRNALPAPELVAADTQPSYLAPRSVDEELLVLVWSRVLGRERIGVHDHFFALGGHSLLATQVVARIRETLGVELPLRSLFEAPTIAQLALRVAQARHKDVPASTSPITPLARARALPLSFAQQRLWFLDRLTPGLANYSIPTAVQLCGPLDLAALRAAFTTIVRRHEALRTTFSGDDGATMQLIAPPNPPALPLLDLQALDQPARMPAARHLIIAATRMPFDLERGPLLRINLLRLQPHDHILFVNMHHIISDGWSMGILIRELTTLYAAFASQQPNPLPPLPLQYADYALWQRSWLLAQPASDQPSPLQAQLAYWKRQLGGALPVLELPTDRPRSPLQTFNGALLSYRFPTSLATQLSALCRQEGVTLFMALLAAFDVLLARYSGQHDIIIGTPIANRTRSEIEGLIGFFVNTLVLRSDLSGNPSVRELLSRVRETTLGAYAHQDVPFEQLVEELQPVRDLSRTPLFQVMLTLQNTPAPSVARSELTLQNTPAPSVEPSELSMRAVSFDSRIAKFDLTLSLQEGGGELFGVLEYNTDLFDTTTIQRLRRHLLRLLEEMVAQPERRVAELELLSASELQQIVVEWNDTWSGVRSQESGVRRARSAAEMLASDSWLLASDSWCVHELVEAQVARTPDAIAVVFDVETTNDELTRVQGSGVRDQRGTAAVPDPRTLIPGPWHITYGELNRRANQLAHHLRRLGVGPEARVGICMERSLELEIALLGVLKAGGAYVPLDPSYPAERLAFMLQDAQVDVLLTNDERPTTNDQLSQLVTLPPCHLVNLAADWPIIARQSTEKPSSSVGAANPAYVIYTSGSTGAPKGVMISHRGICNHMRWIRATFPLNERDRMLQKTPFSFDASVWELFAPLLGGAQLVMARPGGHQDSAYVAYALWNYAITTIQIVPAQLRVLLDEPDLARCDSLVHIFCGGEALPSELAEHCAGVLKAHLHNMYGPTEATIDSARWTYRLEETRRSVPIGRPIANTQLYVLDTRLRAAPMGVAGELYIGGVPLARGYLGRPDLTADRFIPDPFATKDEGRTTNDERRTTNDERRTANGESNHLVTLSPCHLVTKSGSRLYRTGDLALYRADGAIEYLGRIDGQVKLRGYRIELGEIETQLARHPSVRSCAVLLRQEAAGDARLVAYVVPTNDQRPTTNDEASDPSSVIGRSSFVTELRGFLGESLPDYMIPAAFVTLDALPLTPSGKLDRKALPAPEHAAGDGQASYVAPRTAVEELLALIWSQILGRERIGIHDHFFALGGHSLLATQVVARIRRSLGVELPLRSLFETPTIAALAQRIDLARQDDLLAPAPPITPLARTSAPPLSFAQQRLWFLDRLTPGLANYSIPTAVQLRGPLDLPALRAAFTTIVRRHETLRTTFASANGNAVQLIAPPSSPALPLLDLQTLDQPARMPAARQLIIDATRLPFDLERGPLLRINLLRLQPHDHILFVNMHHIISDGWSMGILIRELTTLYAAFATGQPNPLPEPALQYADYAIWQRDWLQAQHDPSQPSPLQAQLAYWKRQLGGALPVLELPTDRPRPPLQTFNGALLGCIFPTSLAMQLSALCRQEGVTLFMALLAAFDVLLARYSGQHDIIIGTPIANRTRSEIEGLIGFFVNTLVLRSDLSGNPSVRELLSRVRETTLDAYAQQDVPFEQLVEELQPVRDLSRTPLFQVMLTLQNTPTPSVELSELSMRTVGFDSRIAKFDLTLSLQEGGGELFGVLEYNTDLFDATTMMRLRGHLLRLLEEMVAQPERRLSELPLLAASERQQLLLEWNDTADSWLLAPDFWCVHELVEAQAARTPDAIAVVFDGPTNDQRMTNDESERSSFVVRRSSVVHLTYAELDRRANQLAQHLRALGVGPEARVGICMERSIPLVLAALGVHKAGGAYVPLDPSYPAERLAFMLADSGAQVLVTNDERPTTNSVTLSPCHLVNLAADWPVIARQPAERPSGRAGAANLAYAIYTSGSTGVPKGVPITHRSLFNLVAWHQRTFGVGRHDRASLLAGVGFDATVWETWPYLTSGASLHLPDSATRAEPVRLRDWLLRQTITISFVPTPLTEALLMLDWPTTSALRYLLTGGDRLRQSPPADLPFTLVNNYGPTEYTVVATTGVVPPAPGDGPARPPAIGRPINNTRGYVLDGRMQLVPLGAAGELYLGGTNLARGYLGRPDLTAERFVPNPFAEVSGIGYRVSEGSAPNTRYPTPNTRLYRTGDLARYRADGAIEYLGRIDHQVKLRGFRIELGEIETQLARHPSVRSCAVLLRQEAAGDARLVAYVVPTNDQRPTTNDGASDPSSVIGRSSFVTELRGFLGETLPDYMIPAAFVTLDALPLTPNGKIDRRALPAPRADHDRAEVLVAPRNELELRLVRMWEALLGATPIGVTDNFFMLGGHSLLAVRLMAQIQQQFGQELPLAALFAAPTVEHLATLLGRAAAPGARSPLVALQSSGSRRPFFCVHPAGGDVLCYYELARQLGADQPFYGLRAPGLDGEQPPYATIGQLAEHYVAALREAQPEGPYLLGGWSFGGDVAFEMAQQLRAQGQEVALLALFDSQVPAPADGPANDEELWLLYGFARDLGLELERFTIALDELRRLDADERLGLVLEQARAANLVPADIESTKIRQLFQVFKANVRAMRAYAPRPYPGQIVFFRAAESLTPDQPDLAHAWAALAMEGVEVFDIPGSHYTIVRPPQVQALAARLGECLDAARLERV